MSKYLLLRLVASLLAGCSSYVHTYIRAWHHGHHETGQVGRGPQACSPSVIPLTFSRLFSRLDRWRLGPSMPRGGQRVGLKREERERGGGGRKKRKRKRDDGDGLRTRWSPRTHRLTVPAPAGARACVGAMRARRKGRTTRVLIPARQSQASQSRARQHELGRVTVQVPPAPAGAGWTPVHGSRREGSKCEGLAGSPRPVAH